MSELNKAIAELGDAVKTFKGEYSERVERIENQMDIVADVRSRLDRLSDEATEDHTGHTSANCGSFTKAARAWRHERGEDFKGQELAADGVHIGHTMIALAKSATGRDLTHLEQKALAAGTGSAGGHTVPELLSTNFIDSLRSRSVLMQAGIQMVPLDGKTRLAKLASDPEAKWKQENAQISNSLPVFDSVEFAPKTLVSFVPASVELIEDSVNLPQMLQLALTRRMALELDRSGLVGDEAHGPAGVFARGTNTPTDGISEPSDFDDLIDAWAAIEASNAGPATASIMSSTRRAAFAKLKDAKSRYLQPPDLIDDIAMLATNSIDDNDLILTGNFTRLMLGMRTEIRLRFIEEALLSDRLQQGWLVYLRADWQPTHMEAFYRQEIGT